ncbi:Uncharacterised protein [Mycoplasmopsis citelli]|uniref:Uncharacterized protein n=1 Tax=Mycoplasmopsis citelli TaxID=171281 RepID=A0A449B304_9BACT|nr:hypothetical protein [Mycoplasmopsis citelli]VEU74963.1 Uncharacterised protein [Mycoplasmopsis citelli]
MKLKHLLLSLSSPLVIFPIAFSVSADPKDGETQKDSDNKDKDKEQEKPKTPPNYAEIKPKQEKLIKEEFEKALNRVEGNISAAIKKIEDLNEKPLPNDLLVKVAYYKKVANFIKNNTKKIIENPQQYGFDVIFPHILVDKEYNFGEIKYNDKDFSPVIIGTKAPNNYEGLKKSDSKSTIKTDGKKPTVNTTDEKTVLSTTAQYFSGIGTATEKIFINAKDLPKFPEQTDFILQENSQYDLKLPEGFNSWDDYIKDKITKEFTAYDIEQNVLFNQQDDKKPQSVKPPIVPLIDGDSGRPPVLEPTIENVPPLEPVLGFEKIASTNNELVGLFQANEEVFNKEYIWWKNTFLESFDYTVTKLENTNNNLEAEVLIIQKSNPANKRTYKAPVKRYRTAQESASYQKVYQEFSKVFIEFLKSLGLDEKLDYEKLANSSLAEALFNQVFLGVKLINEDQFKTKLDNLVQKYQLNTNIVKNDGKVEIQNDQLAQKAQEFLINALSAQEINQYKFFNYLANAYESLYSNVLAQGQRNIKTIETNFQKLDLQVKDLSSGFRSLNSMLKNFKIQAIKNNFSLSDFNSYNKALKDVHKQITDVSLLTKNEAISDKEDPKAKLFKTAYDSLNLNYTEDHSLSNILLWSFAGLSIFGGLIMFFMWIFKKIFAKRKLSKEQNDK